jgi:hypothetical protein
MYVYFYIYYMPCIICYVLYIYIYIKCSARTMPPSLSGKINMLNVTLWLEKMQHRINLTQPIHDQLNLWPESMQHVAWFSVAPLQGLVTNQAY